jgi:hypothetical protein
MSVNLCLATDAEITGNALFSYDLIKEDGEWTGESEQRVNLGMRRMIFDNPLGITFGFVRYNKKFELLEGVVPTYAISLRGKRYSLASGYSARVRRDIVNSQMYQKLDLFLPRLPNFRIDYTRQDTRDTQKIHKINSTTENIQLRAEEEIGPFRVTLSKRESNSEDLARGPDYDTKLSDTSGNIDFAYLYRRLFSLNGRYGMGQRSIQRISTGQLESDTQDFSLGFRITPIPTIALSGTTIGRREERESSESQTSLSTVSNDSLANRIQLILQPLRGILLNTMYSRDDTSGDEREPSSNETKALMLNVEPWRNLAFTGRFTINDSRERERRISTLRRDSFDLRTEPIEGLRFSSRLDLSESTNFDTGLRSHRSNLTTRLDAMLTENLRANMSHDWQKSTRKLERATEEETQHRIAFAADYSFVRMLNLNLRFGKGISSNPQRGTSTLACGLNYSTDESRVSFRYSRTASPGRGTSPSRQEPRITQFITVDFNQEVGQNTSLFLSYEDRLGKGESSYRGTKSISFRMNIRF